jgi:hypothetical protein
MGKLFLDCMHVPSNKGSVWFQSKFDNTIPFLIQMDSRLIEGVQHFRDSI